MEHSAWLNSLFEKLDQFGEEGQAAGTFLRARRTKIAFKRTKPSIGAWWTMDKNINLNSLYYSYDDSLNNTRFLPLIIHEVRHLQHGLFTALSVYGELDAWKVEWGVYYKIQGEYPHPAIEKLMSLPLGWDRGVLRRAVELMHAYATNAYRVDLLPLFPLGKEIAFWLSKKIPQA